MDFILNDYHRNIPNEALLEDLVRVYKLVSKETISQNDYRKHGKYGTQTFIRRFGSWNEALRMCGIQPSVYQTAASKSRREYSSVSTEDLLNDVRYVAECLGKKAITSSEYAAEGKFSKDTCLRRFASWNDVLENAGLEPFDKVAGKRIDDEKLFEEIERIWVLLGRQPTSTDIKNGLSTFSLQSYTRRFGGWRGALQAFVNYINTDEKDVQSSADSLPAAISVSTTENKVVDKKTEVSRKTSRDINLRLRFMVMKRDNFKCCICGASPAKNPAVVLHIDHIKPWSKGGETVIDNLQTLCSECNLGKSDLF